MQLPPLIISHTCYNGDKSDDLETKEVFGKLSTVIIMKLKSAIVHSFLPASSNGRITSTPMKSDPYEVISSVTTEYHLV
ncbi:hypothetical protein TNCV_745621 [Trichonephila clavipes]|nr:hypothetical protein TNCV_745621 [Trichonephila clavipes]